LLQAPNENEEANELNAKVVLENNEYVTLKTLVSLIHKGKTYYRK
jgi:hypothetical protein